MENQKNIPFAFISVIVLGAIIYTTWSTIMKRTESGKQVQGVACTADARQCADGTWVGRSGPDCQFVCPAATGTKPVEKEGTLETGIGKEAAGFDVKITPLKVVEDSRCPKDVQCIQAGTVRVETRVVSGLGTSTPTFTLGKSITTEAEIITLMSVDPLREAGKAIGSKEYVFTFKVSKR